MGLEVMLGWVKAILDTFGITQAIQLAIYIGIALLVYHQIFNKGD